MLGKGIKYAHNSIDSKLFSVLFTRDFHHVLCFFFALHTLFSLSLGVLFYFSLPFFSFNQTPVFLRCMSFLLNSSKIQCFFLLPPLLLMTLLLRNLFSSISKMNAIYAVGYNSEASAESIHLLNRMRQNEIKTNIIKWHLCNGRPQKRSFR